MYEALALSVKRGYPTMCNCKTQVLAAVYMYAELYGQEELS